MSVQRFRTIDESDLSCSLVAGGRGLRVAFQLSEICARLGPVRALRGVHRFRTVEDANRASDAWVRAQLRSREH